MMPSTRLLILWLAALLPAGPLAAQTVLEAPYLSIGAMSDATLTLADVDGDGRPDLLAADDAGPGLLVALNQPQGGFGPPQTSTAAGEPTVLAVADFDGDGLDDVAYLADDSPFGQEPAAQLSAGGGHFLPAAPLPVTNPAADFSTIAALDVDNDGYLDVLLSQATFDRLTVCRGAGNGSFAYGEDHHGLPNARQIALDNVTGDGIPDLVLRADAVGSQLDRIALLAGREDGNFDPPVIAYQSAFVTDLLVADINGDGQAELVICDTNQAPVVVHWLPHAGFGAPVSIDAGPEFTYGGDAEAADVDGDGRKDLALAGINGIVALLLQQPDGTLGEPQSFGTWIVQSSLALRDIDGDGALDIATLPWTGTMLTLYPGQGDGLFEPNHRFEAPVAQLAATDTDLDGLVDLVAVLDAEPSGRILRGRLGGGFEAPVGFDAGPAPRRVSAGRVTADDTVDLLTVLAGEGAGGLAVMPGLPGGGYGAPLITTVPFGVQTGWIGDLDGDGRLDAVLSEFGAPTLAHVFLSDGAGGFADVAAFEAQMLLGDIALGDLDEDGWPDLVASSTDGKLLVLLGQGGGAFAPLPKVDVPGYLLRAAVGDVDDDGHLDVVAASFEQTFVFPGAGDGSLGAAVPQPDSDFEFLRVADIDGDGHPDLLGARALGPEPLEVRLGDGTLAPGKGEPIPGFGTVYTMLPADLDADGKPEVVVTKDDQQFLVLQNATGPWTALGYSLAGAEGFSLLRGVGTLEPGSALSLLLRHGAPLSPTMLVLGSSAGYLPFKGGTLVPAPQAVVTGLQLDAEGALTLVGNWPSAALSGATVFIQAWFVDRGAPAGVAATQSILGTAP